MFGKTVLGVGALLLASATAETAPGFPIRVSENLTVTYGNNTVSPGGELIPRPETATRPTISSPVWWADAQGPGPCILLMVDLDVPRNNTRVQLIHWLATNITRSSPISANTTGASLLVPSANPVPYLQPSPPVGDIPHSYTFLLMAEPQNFTFPEAYEGLKDNRVGFNVSAFLEEANLTQGVSASWITVQNLTDTPSNSSFPPARPSPSETPGAGAASGDAVGGRLGGRTFWTGIGTAVLAGGFAVAL